MKRIIDGRTYNTDTATIVASWEYEDWESYDTAATLYRTKGGAFFAVHVRQVLKDEAEKVRFEAMTRSEVDRMIERIDNLKIHDNTILADPPEAEAEEEETGATVYARVPVSLKNRIDGAARGAGLSVNSWMIRCAERCLAPTHPDAAIQAEIDRRLAEMESLPPEKRAARAAEFRDQALRLIKHLDALDEGSS